MTGEDIGAVAPVRSLEIAVRTDPERVAAFQAATAGPAGEGLGLAPDEPAVPLTYPFCWMTLPEVRPMLERMIGGAGLLPIHEAQTFEYHRSLMIDAEYRVAFSFERKAGPARLIVNAAVSIPGGETCATFETVLRLVPATPPPAAEESRA
jgi:hypothetical protein